MWPTTCYIFLFRARARIPPGHVFVFVGLRVCGVVGLWVCGVAGEKNERRKEILVWLKNDAQVDTQIC